MDTVRGQRASVPLAPMLLAFVVAPVLIFASFVASAASRSSLQAAAVMSDRRDELVGGSSSADVAGLDDLVVGMVNASARAHSYELAASALLVAALLAMAAGIGCGLASRTRRDAAVRAPTVDQLTGLGDLAVLERRGRALLLDRRYTHHAVVSVSVDDLDVIGEIYGDGQADRVQVDLARRLRSAADWLVGERDDATATLGRVAPGEFLVMLHARESIDATTVRSSLSLHSGRIIRFGLDRIPVRHSVGIHIAGHGASLGDAIDRAKSDRHTLHALVAQPAPPVVGTLSFTR